MSSLPLGSSARQWRPVLSWRRCRARCRRSGRRGSRSSRAAARRSASRRPRQNSACRCSRVLEQMRVPARCSRAGRDSVWAMSAWKPRSRACRPLRAGRPCRFQLVHAAPSRSRLRRPAARRGPRRPSPASRNVSAIFLRVAFGIVRTSAPGPSAESMRIDAVLAHAMLVEASRRCGKPFRPPATKLLAVARRRPSPSRRPCRGQTGATSEPTAKPVARDLVGHAACRSSSLASGSVCGWNRNRSTPSNFSPLTSAAAVRSSIVSRLDRRLGRSPALCRRGRATWRCAVWESCVAAMVECSDGVDAD